MDINNFLEPFQQFGHQFQEAPEQARQFVEQHIPAAPKLPAPSILGS